MIIPIISELVFSVVGLLDSSFCMSDGTIRINSVHETEQCAFRLVYSCVSVCIWLY